MPPSLPSFPPFPSTSQRKSLSIQDWDTYLELCLTLLCHYLSLPREKFSSSCSTDSSISTFLLSYVEEAATGLNITTTREKCLKRDCYFLTHRTFTQGKVIPPSMLDWNFLANLAVAYGSTSSVSDLMAEIEKRVVSEQVPQLRQGSKALVRLLEEEIPVEKGLSLNAVVNELGRHVALLKVSRSYSYLLMVGSDVMDALVIAWARASVELQNKLLVIVYRAFSRLLDDEDPKISLLLDQLYSLIATQKKTDKQSLLFQLAATTNLMRKLQKLAPGSNATRLRSFIAQMEGLGLMGNTRPKRLIRRKIGKEKKNDDEYGHGAMGYVHVHRMSLITQIQDVFPELGSGFIIKLLDEYDDATEQIITHLLEDSLPDHLKTADRTENIKLASNHSNEGDLVPSLIPRPTSPLLPSRKNIFDNDDFDNLTVNASKLHIGRKNPDLTADDLLADHSTALNKAAILSALATFDSDDDERDDTYDVEDVGGTVDSAMPGSDEIDADLRDNNEEALFRAYTMSPEAFERNSDTRRSKARQALRSETEMTDEAIEGWAIMIVRNPRRLRRLEAKFSTFAGVQRELASTAYREGAIESSTEDSDGTSRGRGGFRGRGRGRGGRGRGGDVSGPVSDQATQVARQRKDAHKGSRVNHNRRDQRAKKVARAVFAS